MQNTSNDTKHRYKLILCSILILECDFRFNFNLKLNNVTETTSFYTWPLKATVTTRPEKHYIPTVVTFVNQLRYQRYSCFLTNNNFWNSKSLSLHLHWTRSRQLTDYHWASLEVDFPTHRHAHVQWENLFASRWEKVTLFKRKKNNAGRQKIS